MQSQPKPPSHSSQQQEKQNYPKIPIKPQKTQES